MGFRSTFVSEAVGYTWPNWIHDKYKDSIRFPRQVGCVASKTECKIHFTWPDLLTDIQKALLESDPPWRCWPFVMVFMHECRGLTFVKIDKDGIQCETPAEMEKCDDVYGGHDYGCGIH